ncbi:NUDIX domain-containing protein [Flavobacteriaceae bacterium Ap0902]|nr:NUDIX domain-containing protein [Flavobacteriaceae bacterium Ap0902]
MPKFFQYCPRCGSQNHKFENHHRFECFNCGFIYYHNCAAAVMVILRRGDEILFTVRNNDPCKGMLDFPGGFVDPKESGHEAVIRELKEELNLDLTRDQISLIDTEPNDYKYRDILYRTLDIIFEINLHEDITIELDHSEIREVKWLKKEEVDLEAIAFNSMKEVVRKYIL